MSANVAGVAPLTAWRSVDWRFLLPESRIGAVGYLGRPPDDELRVLEELGVGVVTDSDSVAGCDVVVLEEPDVERPDIGRLLRSLRPGTWVLVRLSRTGFGAVPRLGKGALAAVRRRLCADGLLVTGCYWHAPDRDRCSYLVEVGDRLAVSMMLRRYHGVRFGLVKSLVARAANRVSLSPVVARDVTVVAQRLDAGVPAGGSDDPASHLVVTPWFEASRHVISLEFDPATGAMTSVAKIPRRPWDTGGIRHEAGVLRDVARRTRELAGQVPEVHGLSLGARPRLIESALAGSAVGPELVRTSPRLVLEATARFLERLPISGSAAEDPAWFERLIEKPLLDAVRRVDVEGLPELVDLTLARLGRLREADFPLVVEHGDLGHPNLILTADHRLAAVDWERSTVHGLPGHDLFFWLQYVGESRRGTFERPGQLSAFEEAFVGSGTWTAPWIRRYCESLRLDQEQLAPLLLATWARSSAGLVSRLHGADAGDGSVPAGAREGLSAVFAVDRDFALWRHASARYDALLS